jgi:Tyrosyl-DNA phosphodiesterase
MGAIGWESLLKTDAPPECTLVRALFTTYDRADERLLVEHALPLFLKLGHEPGGEGAERQYFLIELDRRLRQMHDRIVVVSSNARDEPVQQDGGDSAYQWIWRSIRHLTVGSRGRAVQHAKVWLLHWSSPNGPDYLEIVVSSANLTLAALRGQLQAAWRTVIVFKPQRSEARLAGWGILPGFLGELAISAGDVQSLAPFVEMLARCECPEGITFLASVPGVHSRSTLRRTPWGAAGLTKIAPTGSGAASVSIMAPYVGAWNSETIRRWCSNFGGTPQRLKLVWIEKDHPWQRYWLLPKDTLRFLLKAGASLVKLGRDPAEQERSDAFHAQHRQADDRWSHAKLYHIRRGNSRRLLVTSANFSLAAWGSEDATGILSIENFELGVCVEQADWPFEQLDEFEDENDIATVAGLDSRSSPLITWARAAWDGQEVGIECRCLAPSELLGDLRTGTETTAFAGWNSLSDTEGLYRANLPYSGDCHTPFVVELTCRSECLRIPIFDERKLIDRENTILPEVDQALVQNLRDHLLFEEYGGRIAADDPDVDSADGSIDDLVFPEDEGDDDTTAGHSESYAVPAFVLARRHLAVVDIWADAVKEVSKRLAGDFRRRHLQRDGELLVEAFGRQAERDGILGPTGALGARLAAEEIAIRLKHFPEE